MEAFHQGLARGGALSKMKVGAAEVEYDFDAELRIDRSDLDAELGDQPRLFAKWAALSVEARFVTEQRKVAMDKAMAEADAHVRAKMVAEGEKITEAKVSNAVPLEEPVVEARDEFLEAGRAQGHCGVMEAAFGQRASMLKQLSENWRAERFMDPSTQVGTKTATQGRRMQSK